MYLNNPVLLRMKFINISTMKYEKQDYFRAKGKSYTTSSCPILQGRKAAKAGGCSGAI
jgi:hypothetical protein